MIQPVTTYGNPLRPEPPTLEKQPIPWLTMIVVGALVFVVGHRLDFSVATDWSTYFGSAAEGIAEGSPRRRLGFFLLGLWGVATIILARPRYKLRLNGLLPLIAMGFLLWALLSLLWAVDPALALRRLVILGMVTVATIGILRQFSLRELVLFITLASLAYAMIGVAAELAYGTFRPLSADYRFAGTVHPNRQGMNLAAVILGGLCLSRISGSRRWFFVIVTITGLLLLLLTRSRTATGATLIALAVFVGLRSSPLRLTAMLMSAGAVGLLIAFLLQNEALSTPWQLILMGREQSTELVGSLSGRTRLWSYLWSFAIERPVVGYGYNSFMSPERAGEMPALVAWGVSETHSLYLELLLGTGFVGLALFVTILLGSLGRAVFWSNRLRDPDCVFLATYLVFLIFNGFLIAITIFPGPKLFGFLVLGYVLLRDRVREVPESEPAPDPRLASFVIESHGMARPSIPEWPPASGVSPEHRAR